MMLLFNMQCHNWIIYVILYIILRITITGVEVIEIILLLFTNMPTFALDSVKAYITGSYTP